MISVKLNSLYKYCIIGFSFCSSSIIFSPVSWDCKIHQLHLYREVRPPPHTHTYTMSVLDMTLNWIWWWGSTPGPFQNVKYFIISITPRSTLTRVAVPIKVLSVGQIEIFNHLLYLKPFNYVQTINCNTWNHLTVYKQMHTGSVKNNVTYKLFI